MKKNLDNEPLSHGVLILLGFYMNPCEEYCPPSPAHGGMYRLDFHPTIIDKGIPVYGSEVWRAYLTDKNCSTIRTFSNLGELNFFHKGMCGEFLYK